MQTVVTYVTIIGGFSGLIALIFQLLEYLLKKPKINCKLDDVYDSYWISGDKIQLINSDESEEYLNRYQDFIVLSLQIDNVKNVPITINGIYKNNIPIFPRYCFKDPSIEEKMYFKENSKLKIQLVTLNKQFNAPCKLSGYDSVKEKIIYPVDKSSDQIRYCDLLIKTPYKNFKYCFKIHSAKYTAEHKKIGLIKAALVDKENHLKRDNGK